jgi:hypothetical protein
MWRYCILPLPPEAYPGCKQPGYYSRKALDTAGKAAVIRTLRTPAASDRGAQVLM